MNFPYILISKDELQRRIDAAVKKERTIQQAKIETQRGINQMLQRNLRTAEELIRFYKESAVPIFRDRINELIVGKEKEASSDQPNASKDF